MSKKKIKERKEKRFFIEKPFRNGKKITINSAIYPVRSIYY